MNIQNIIQKTRNEKIIKNSLKLRIGILAIFIFLAPLTSQAKTFNPNNIITDQELINKDSLSKTAIQNFLEREDSVLGRYSQVVEGKTMKVSEMIWEIGQKHNISPKFLLTTLEKEQGLVHSTQATEKAMDWATGYGCYGGGCKEKYRGFYNQLEASAETQQIYWEKAGQFSFGVGKTTQSSDGYPVTPVNKATANLYIYTPYVGYSPELGVTDPYGGNRLFWRIWQRYFTNQKFLDGQLITREGKYWLIQNNTKRQFISKELFLQDYDENEAINVSSDTINAYPDGPQVEFANNTVVKSLASGQIYLLTENQKRPIIDNAALALLSDIKMAINSTQIPSVNESKISHYSLGGLITSNATYPQGKLFKDDTGLIWQVKDGLKHEVDSKVWQNRFDSQTPEPANSSNLEIYPTGAPLKLKDGTFVTANSSYYIISNGERVKISDLGIFDRVFGISKKNNALSISTTLLEIHDAGDSINYIDDTVQDSPSSVVIPATPTSGSYNGQFVGFEPSGLIIMGGTSQSVIVKFKNTGGATWRKGEVSLAMTDKGKATSSFSVVDVIEMDLESVSTNQDASFTFNLTAPANLSGLQTQDFSLYYNKNGTPTKMTSVAKFIIVKPAGATAEITDHNIPLAVSNKWKPIQITMKIKNTSADTTWTAQRTVLELYNLDNTTSYFYDPADWVRKEVAAIPIGKTYIKPGEIGEFKFTLDPRNITPNSYIMNFQLKLLDQDEQLYLNGQKEWHQIIRVD